MNKTVENLSDSIVGIRGSTITVGVVDTIKVSYHGQLQPIKHIAYTGKNGDAIFIDPYEPELTNQIAKVLKEAGFSAYAFSKTRVVVSVPPPSGDQRKSTIAHLRKLGEEAKIAIRNVRKKQRQQLEKESLVIEDKKIQEITDSNIAEIDLIIEGKIKSL
jgi:ribosome recycling factor